MGKSPVHASSVGLIRNLNTRFISLQYHVIYDTRFQTVSGGYEDNEAIARYIWYSLALDQRENVLTEANVEQETLTNLHRDWLYPEKQVERKKTTCS